MRTNVRIAHIVPIDPMDASETAPSEMDPGEMDPGEMDAREMDAREEQR